jgi:hypothetical protein
MRSCAPFAACLLACSQPAPPAPHAPAAPVSTDVARWVAEVSTDADREDRTTRLVDAEGRFLSGDNAEPSDLGRAAYRTVCREHAVEREMTLDELRERAQIHTFAWREWYKTHCLPIANGLKTPNSVAIDRDTGKALTDSVYVCGTDAGTPPARVYERSSAEVLAQARRDACERAQ